MQARTPKIEELVEECARGNLAFSGPGSLCAQVHQMGYNVGSLFWMVVARKEELDVQQQVA